MWGVRMIGWGTGEHAPGTQTALLSTSSAHQLYQDPVLQPQEAQGDPYPLGPASVGLQKSTVTTPRLLEGSPHGWKESSWVLQGPRHSLGSLSRNQGPGELPPNPTAGHSLPSWSPPSQACSQQSARSPRASVHTRSPPKADTDPMATHHGGQSSRDVLPPLLHACSVPIQGSPGAPHLSEWPHQKPLLTSWTGPSF